MSDSPALRAAFLMAILFFAVLLWKWLQRDARLPLHSGPPIVVVEVQGDVGRPGVYALEGPTADVADALGAAGGVSGKSLEEIPQGWLRRRIETASLLRVISPPSDGAVEIRFESMSAAARLTLGLKLDVNTADKEDLLLLPGMKPEIAAALVSRRRENPWRSLDDLNEISGVGPKTIEKWKPHLIVGPTSPQQAP